MSGYIEQNNHEVRSDSKMWVLTNDGDVYRV